MYLRKLARTLILVLGTIGLAACHRSAPILNLQDQPIPARASELSSDEVARRIRLAGAPLGWRFEDVRPGELRGTYQKPGHAVTIAVSFTPATYSINLVSSINMSQGPGGTINPNYNRWVENLRKQIDTQLAMAGLQ
jgi:hypothetical protein